MISNGYHETIHKTFMVSNDPLKEKLQTTGVSNDTSKTQSGRGTTLYPETKHNTNYISNDTFCIHNKATATRLVS